MTGITSSTIHSGRLSLSRMASTIFRRLMRSFFFCFEDGLGQVDPQLLRELDEVQFHEQLADGLGAHVGVEGPFAVLLAGFAVLVFGEELLRLQGRVAGAGDDVVLEVDDLFQARGLHGQQGAQAAGHGLEEPDVHHRRGQLDVAHPLAADAAVGDLHAATVADHALVLHAAVLAAGALPVLLGSEDPLAEQAVLLGAIGAVVDRFRLFHFAERPTADIVGAGQADLDRRIVVDPIVCRFADTHWNASLDCRKILGGVGPEQRMRKSGNIDRMPLRPLPEHCPVIRQSCFVIRPTSSFVILFRQARAFSNCMFRPRPRISLVNTSKLAGVPASSVFSPLTIDS